MSDDYSNCNNNNNNVRRNQKKKKQKKTLLMKNQKRPNKTRTKQRACFDVLERIKIKTNFAQDPRLLR